MSNLEKIQKGMRVLKIFSKIILIVSIVGTALTSIGAILVASNVLNEENQYLHFLLVPAGISKSQLMWTLVGEAVPLLSGIILAAFAYRYFVAELKEGTPFTDAGADRIRQLGSMEIVLSVLSISITGGIQKIIGQTEWSIVEEAGSIAVGVCLILLALVVRYGAELEQRSR